MRTMGAAAQDKPPLVVVEKQKGAMRLVALSRAAKRAGLAAGLTLADARARIPDLWVEEADAAADAALLETIADDCDRISPIIMIDSPDGLLIDITGCDHLFEGEAKLRTSLSQRLRRAGLHVRTVIAGAPDTARALARFGSVAIVPPGGEMPAVRRLPVVALGLPADDQLALQRAGIKTVGAIADRASEIFTQRFGETMRVRAERLQGVLPAPLTPRRIIPTLWVEQRFAEPIGHADHVEAALKALVDETCRRLSERREGGRVFEAVFYRTDGAVRRIAIETGRPMRHMATIMRLFHERLDALADPLDPGFGFDQMRLGVLAVDPLDALQAGLDGRAIEMDEIADLTDRLSTRFGFTRVLRFLREDTHDPDRAARMAAASFNPMTSMVWPSPETGEPPVRPSLIFYPPQMIEVSFVEVPDGPPRRFSWRRTNFDVMRAEGPERIAPEWWRAPDADLRDYYRVEDADGRRFWLFRAGDYGPAAYPSWYLHGMFA